MFERRSPRMILRRLLSALMGIAFVLATSVPMAGHRCLARGSAREAMPPMPGMPAAPHDHGHSDHHSHECTCLGSCCCVAVVTIASDRLVALPIAPIAVVATIRAMESATLRPAQPDGVVLPPPLGPPALPV